MKLMRSSMSVLPVGMILVAALGLPAWAAADTLTLTLEEVIAKAHDADHNLQAARLDSLRSEAAWHASRYERYPSLSLGAGYERERELDPPVIDVVHDSSGEIQIGESVPDRFKLQARLRQELFSGFRRSAQIAEQDYRREATRLRELFLREQVELAAVEQA